jgi:hypothetical protein
LTKITITRANSSVFNYIAKAKLITGEQKTYPGKTVEEAVAGLIFGWGGVIQGDDALIIVRQILHNPEKFGIELEFRGPRDQLVKPPKHLRKK